MELEILTTLLHRAPGSKLLVTSREALNLREEWLYPILGLAYPHATAAGTPTDYAAVQLFADRARRVRPGFALADEYVDVVRICRLVEGMPLALELAATWTKTLRCERIAAEIEQNLGFLSTRLRDLPERHQSMRAVFERSWALLSHGEQAVFARLCVFHGGFDDQAAQQAAGASLVLLAGLVDKSLVRWQAGGRYQIHELLRQYAEEELAAAPDELQGSPRCALPVLHRLSPHAARRPVWRSTTGSRSRDRSRDRQYSCRLAVGARVGQRRSHPARRPVARPVQPVSQPLSRGHHAVRAGGAHV